MAIGIAGAILAAAGVGAVGSAVTGALGLKSASDAQGFSKKQYARRYQVTMDDMRKAGLNPMLAYSQGVSGNAPTGVMPSLPDLGSTLSGSMATGAKIAKAPTEAELLTQQMQTSAAQAEESRKHAQLFQGQWQTEAFKQKNIFVNTTAQELRNADLFNAAEFDATKLGKYNHWLRRVLPIPQLQKR